MQPALLAANSVDPAVNHPIKIRKHLFYLRFSGNLLITEHIKSVHRICMNVMQLIHK